MPLARRDAGYQIGELGIVAAIERKIHDLPLANNSAERRARGVDHRGLPDNGHRFTDRADLEGKIQRQFLVYSQAHTAAYILFKAGFLNRDVVLARVERRG